MMAVIILATGRYIDYADRLVISMRKNFNPSQGKHFFILTDVDRKDESDVLYRYVKHQAWPNVTLNRYHNILSLEKELFFYSHILHVDADSLFVKPLTDELTTDRVFVHEHFGWKGPGTPEERQYSMAYTPPSKRKIYLNGALTGGPSKDYLDMCRQLVIMIDEDKFRDIIAIWHDESHLNAWAARHDPIFTKDLMGQHDQPILALDKDICKIRS